MDLRDTPSAQLIAHIDWLRQRFTGDSPPSPAVWDELSREAIEHALFAEAFVLPKIADPTTHLPTLHIIRGVGVGANLVAAEERTGAESAHIATYEPAGEPSPHVEEPGNEFLPSRPNGVKA